MKKPAAPRPERLAAGLIESIDFHGLAALRLRVPSGASAVVSAFGAQVLSWTTADGRERLFLSERAVFDGNAPIRGGVPVCFPQFAGLGPLPKHGFARTRTWSESGRSTGKDYAMVSFALEDDAATRRLWPHAFRAEITVNLENNRLDVELGVDNTGDAPLAFTAALHSYLRVTEVEDSYLEGLYGHEYRDAARGDRIVKDTGTRLGFEGETDRVYHGVRRPLLVNAGNLSLGLDQEGFPDVVVWNPWVERCAALADMAPSGWRHLLCVEAAAVRVPVTLAAGEGWSGRQSLVPV